MVKCTVSLLLLSVLVFTMVVNGRQIPRPSVRQNFYTKLSLFDPPKSPNSFLRGRRCLSSALTLLWPQVVGPVDQGVIEEKGYNEVPKTHLEYRLDMLRKKAREEEEGRLMVRDYLKKLMEAQKQFYGTDYDNSVSSYF